MMTSHYRNCRRSSLRWRRRDRTLLLLDLLGSRRDKCDILQVLLVLNDIGYQRLVVISMDETIIEAILDGIL